uniref:Putative secreted protein n=1 Tax=Anopheles darlingi TaxID=43151 RepID=A0A2M4DGG5_ANODA
MAPTVAVFVVLFVGKLRCTLLNEGRHTLETILGGEGGMEVAPFELQSFVQRRLVGRVDRFLAQTNDQGREGGNLFTQLNRLRDQLVGRNHLADEPRPFRFLGRDHVTGQTHLHGLRFAHRASRTLGTTGTGDRTERNLRLAEPCLIAGVDNVTHHRQLAATAERVPVNGRNDRLLCLGHSRPVGQEVGVDALGVRVRLHFLDVGTGRERLLAARDHDRSDRIVRLVPIQCVANFGHQPIAQRIQCLRSVQRDKSHILLLARQFRLDEFVRFGSSAAVEPQQFGLLLLLLLGQLGDTGSEKACNVGHLM